MATKVIVSYDGTDNDRDALALAGLLARAGASVALAYVRHAQEVQSGRERIAAQDAQALLQRGAETLGLDDVHQHVVVSGSTPIGLRDLAVVEGADLIVFGSEYRTARGHVDPQPSARRLLEGGPVAIGIAPAGFADMTSYLVKTIAALGEEGDPTPFETAESLAGQLEAEVVPPAAGAADFVIVGSRPGTVDGRVTISAAAEYVVELSRCPVIVLPRGRELEF